MAEDWLRIGEAAMLSKHGRTTIHEAVRRGELPCACTANGRLFRRADVLAWATARGRGGLEGGTNDGEG